MKQLRAGDTSYTLYFTPSALHILIVDHSPEDRLTMRRLLTRAAPGIYTITEADRGDRALAAFQSARPDCILIDYLLPDMNDLEVIAALRSRSDVPIAPGPLCRDLGCPASQWPLPP